MAEIAAQCAARLRGWLLHGPAQCMAGAQAGGIVGTLDGAGRAHYVYAEITGYYLHWLADLDGEFDARRARAQSAIAWCERQFGSSLPPPTRVYLDQAPDDWRNRTAFFFDWAMLIAGVAAATRAGLIAPPHDLLRRLASELERFVERGEIRAVRKLAPDLELPDRWSTREDRFLVKATTRVQGAATETALPAPLVTACERLNTRRAPQAGEAPVEMLHPTLYYLEGVVCLDRAHWSGAARLLARMLDLTLSDGSLPESPDSSDVPRADVIAQALRLGVFLRAHEVPGAPSDVALDCLVTQLTARVDGDGAIAFVPDAPSAQLNVWCAMFAEQALRWYARWHREPSFHPDARALV